MKTSNTQKYKLYVLQCSTTGKGKSAEEHAIRSLGVTEYQHDVQGKPRSKPVSFHSEIAGGGRTASSKGAMDFEIMWGEFQAFITIRTGSSQTPLFVCHNAPFALSMLDAEIALKKLSLPPPSWKFACSLELAHKLRDARGEKEDSTDLASANPFDIDQNEQVSLLQLHNLPVRVMDQWCESLSVTDATGEFANTSLSFSEMVDLHSQKVTKDSRPMTNTGPTSSSRAGKNEKSVARERFDEIGKTQVYTTETGKYFHFEKNCEYLRFAHYMVPTFNPPNDLTACPKCQSSSTTSEANSAEAKPTYIITRYGKYFHKDRNCRYLNHSSNLLSTDCPDDFYGPCPVCISSDKSTEEQKRQEGKEEEQQGKQNEEEQKEEEKKEDKQKEKEKEEDDDDDEQKQQGQQKEERQKEEQENEEQEKEEEESNQQNMNDKKLSNLEESRSQSQCFNLPNGENGPFFVTKTGTKLHAANCWAVKDIHTKQWDSNEKSRSFKPCSKCLPNLQVI